MPGQVKDGGHSVPNEPTADWKTDYDIFSKECIKDPYPIWDDLR